MNSLSTHPRLEWTAQRLQRSVVLKFFLGLCWCFLHLFVSVVHLLSRVIYLVQCYMVSSGLLKHSRTIRLDKLRYLALVVDSEEAKDKAKIRQLLLWLSAIGVKNVIMYDIQGVLKKSMETDLRSSTNSSSTPGFDAGVGDISSVISHEKMAIELLSLTDGKEAVAKAASFLCSKYLDNNNTEKVFTESDMENALKAVGCSGPEPDLLLVYGPARCHLGFPSWRLRYTEIVHMGSLKSMKYGAIVKAIYDFSKKHQNYGT